MAFPLDYDSTCDTCTPAVVCVFIFKSFAVLSTKSRSLPVKSDSWGKRKSLFSFFVLGVCCWDFGFVVVCFLSFLETGWHACSWGWPQTHSVVNNDLLRLGCMHPPIPYWKLCLLNDFFCMWKLSSHPLLRRWESSLSFCCCCFYPIPFSTRPKPHPDMWYICIILELLNLGVGMPSLFMCARP